MPDVITFTSEGDDPAVAVVRASTGPDAAPVRPAQGCELGVPPVRKTRPPVVTGSPCASRMIPLESPMPRNRHAGFGERGEETCPWESDCGLAAKAPDKPPIPYRLRASPRLYKLRSVPELAGGGAGTARIGPDFRHFDRCAAGSRAEYGTGRRAAQLLPRAVRPGPTPPSTPLERFPLAHEVADLPHQGLVPVDHRLGGVAVFVEAGRRHGRLDLLDLAFAFGYPPLELADALLPGRLRALEAALVLGSPPAHVPVPPARRRRPALPGGRAAGAARGRRGRARRPVGRGLPAVGPAPAKLLVGAPDSGRRRRRRLR